MPYNSDIHSNISYVDKRYKVLLNILRKNRKPQVTEKAMLEHIIEQAAKGDTQ